LNRPKDETVLLSRQELRDEPFWHITAVHSIDYCCRVVYQVPVHNPYAQSIELEPLAFDVARQKEKARIELTATERCHRKIPCDTHLDAMNRQIRSEALQAYLRHPSPAGVGRSNR
jgi:hypothetical protein